MQVAEANLSALLEPYRRSLGEDAMTGLPIQSLQTFVTFPGNRYIVFPDYARLTLRNVKGGYGVYNRHFCLQYGIPFSLEARHQALYIQQGLEAVVPEFTFGLDLQDQVFITQNKPGDFFYLSYETQWSPAKTIRQTDIVLISPVSVLTVLAPGG